jgi:hypothetical protein
MADWREQWERSNLLDSETWTVDWSQAGLAAVGVILTSFFDAVAQVVGTVWETFVIRPATAIAREVTALVSYPLAVLEVRLDFGAAEAFASEIGLLGSVLVVGGGFYLLAYLYGEVIQDG